MRSERNSSLLFALFLCPALAAAGVAPADLIRNRICLNGDWELAFNAGDDHVPTAGWRHQRVPALPLVTNPPTVSAWYRRSISIPREWAKPHRKFFLQLDKVGHYAAVYCNGRRIAQHYGQYDPVEGDLTGVIKPGQANEIAVYVHNASDKYARPGAVITEAFEGNAYRGAAEAESARNWIGIVGDIFLSWRPDTYIDDVFVVPSVRHKRLEARVTTAGAAPGLVLRGAVLDGEEIVLELPEQSIGAGGSSNLQKDWSDPVLWGPPPYGEPKLYVLRTELVKDGKVIDRSFTRFGFREVWISGRDVMLNGKKLWMAGAYYGKLDPLRYFNDRHPQSLMIGLMQSSGLNTLHGHWDDLGTPWMDRCDEMGMLVLGGFYCDGRPKIHSKADDGWSDWIVGTCSRWVRVVRNHPSIVMWRPVDVVPPNMHNHRPQLFIRLAAEVRREDGTRPVADDSDITAWSQSQFKSPDVYDDASGMAAALAASTKPFLTKELHVAFKDTENLSRFFQVFYAKSFQGGSAGVIVQGLPLMERHPEFRLQWLSDSGPGNRDITAGAFPNWCDPDRPAWRPTPYNGLFADLYQKFMRRAATPSHGETAGELLVSGLTPDELAILVPKDPELAKATGVRVSGDGKAWFAVPQGRYHLCHHNGSQEITVLAAPLSLKPGYDYVQRVSVSK
jgi:hypothetical protein